MSEDKEPEESIPDMISNLNMGSGVDDLKPVLEKMLYCDRFHQIDYIDRIKVRTGKTKQYLKSLLDSLTDDDDTFYIKVYEQVSNDPEFKDKVVSMADNRQIMIRHGNVYKQDIISLRKKVSEACEPYKIGYRGLRDDVLEKFKDMNLFDRKNFCYDQYLINFKNGYYDIGQDKFISTKENNKQETPKLFFYEIPHNYDEKFKGDCIEFKKALSMWLGSNSTVTSDDMFEFIGYSMSMGVGQKKAFMIFGETNTGKTQFREVVVYLIGSENVSETSLHRMGEDKFGLQEIPWKILNYFDDLSDKVISDVSFFKVVVGGTSSVTVEEKGVKPYKVVNTLKLWFNTNRIPKTKSNEDSSFFERWALVPFKTQFSFNRKNRNENFYMGIIKDKNEVQGIIHEAIKGLRRLYERGHFRTEIFVNTEEMWKKYSDPLYDFLNTYTEASALSNMGIDRTDFFKSYNKFRVNKRLLNPITLNELNKDIKRFPYISDTRISVDRKQVWAYVGIKWNSSYIEDNKANFSQDKIERTKNYYDLHPEAIPDDNAAPEPNAEHSEHFDFGFTETDFDDKDKFEIKIKKRLKKV